MTILKSITMIFLLKNGSLENFEPEIFASLFESTRRHLRHSVCLNHQRSIIFNRVLHDENERFSIDFQVSKNSSCHFMKLLDDREVNRVFLVEFDF